MKRVLAEGTLAVVSLLIGLLLAEGMVRVVRPQLTYRFPRGLFVADPVTSYGLTPGFRGELNTPEYRTDIRVNAQGLRDDREFGPKSPGTVRILMIGDSFTMGVGVAADATLARQLERALVATGTAPVEVVNAGVPGYGTRQEVAQLEARGLAWSPDLVLLVMFVGNDVDDNASPPHVVQDGYLVGPDAPPTDTLRGKLLRFLGLQSQLYHLVQPWKDQLTGHGGDLAAQRRAAFLGLHGVDATGRGWTETAAAVAHFAEVVRRAGVRGAVVVIPERAQVSPPLWAASVTEAGVVATDVSPTAATARLRRDAEAVALPVLDLSAALGSGPDGGSDGGEWYFPQDHHLTAAGVARAVTALGPFVREALGGAEAAHGR